MKRSIKVLIGFLFILFNVFILNVNAINFDELNDDIVYLNLDDNKTFEITLNNEDYYISSCYGETTNGNILLNTENFYNSCSITASNFGRTLLRVSINKNNEPMNEIKKYVLIDIDSEKYMNQVINNIPDSIDAKAYSTEFYNIIEKYIPKGISYTVENCSVRGEYEYCDFNISYSYVKGYKEDDASIWDYITESKNVRFLNNGVELPYIPSANLNLGDTIQNYLSGISIPNEINPDDLVFISTNNTVVGLENGNLISRSPGQAEIRLYNKNTLEYSKSYIYVKEPTYNNIDEFLNHFNNLKIEIDASTLRYENYYSTPLYEYLAEYYFSDIIPYLSYDFNIYSYDATCTDNKCKVTFEYSKNGFYENRVSKSTAEFSITYKGISSGQDIQLSIEEYEQWRYINFDLYLDKDDNFNIIYDEEYLDYKVVNDCVDKDGMWMDCSNEGSVVKTTNYAISPKKVGETTIQIISSEGYMEEIKVYITHTNEENNELNDYFNNLNSINLPYQSIDFIDNLYYLEEIIKNNILNEISNYSLSKYVKLDVECIFYDKCTISGELRKQIDENYYNGIYIGNLPNKVIYVNYDTLTSNNIISSLINETKKINNVSLSLDDTIELENSYNSDEFYDHLIDKTNIKEIINNSIFDISYEVINTENLNERIKGNTTYRLYFKYDNKVIFNKDVTVYSNHLIILSPREKNSIEARIEYIKKYVEEIINIDVNVEYVNDNMYKVYYNEIEFYLILDQKEIITIQHVYFNNNLIDLNVGDKYKATYSKYPIFANSGEVTFESKDENVATVDENGIITAVNEGYTRIVAKVNHSMTSMWVLVNRDMQAIINEKLNTLDTNVTILYGDIYDDLDNAIRNAVWNKNYKKDLDGFVDKIVKENGKYYYYLETYTNYATYVSDKKEINYELKGIKVNSKNIEINTGDIYDLGLYFTEGDLNNLIIDFDNKDVVKITKDGKIIGLKPGYTYVNITDKYNKYYNYTKVIVDKEKFYYDSIKNAQKRIINVSSNSWYDRNIKFDDFDEIISSIFENKLQEYIPFYVFEKYYDATCDIDNKTCTLFISDKYNDFSDADKYDFNIELNGVFIESEIKDILINEIYDPNYIKFPSEGEVSIESLDTDLCIIDNGSIKGVNSGVCPIQYSLNGINSYQLVIVDRENIINNIKNKYDLIDNNLMLNLEHYVSPFKDGIEWQVELTDYVSLYNAEIFYEIENRLDLPYDIYFHGVLDSLETNPYELDIALNAYYSFEKDNNYISLELIENYDRTFNIDYNGMTKENKELGEKVKSNLKDRYYLDLAQTLRYQMDGAPNFRMYAYSSLEEDIMEICPKCTYILDENGPAGGGGDETGELMGGNIIILKDGNPITAKTIEFEVRFVLETEVVESIDEIINLIIDKVKEAYLQLFNPMPINTYSTRLNKFNALRSIPEPDVEVKRVRDEKTGDAYYNIKVEDIEFNANVEIKTTGDAVYTTDVTDIILNDSVVNLTLGNSKSISYEVLPNNATNKNVNWSSSNSSIAAYENGKIIAKGIGNAVITVTAHNGVKKTINVNVTLPVVNEDDEEIKVPVTPDVDNKPSDNKPEESKPSDNIGNNKPTTSEKDEIVIKVKKGDINLDGKVNMTDLIKLRQQQAGLENLNTEAMINADINNDGKVNMTDIIKLRKYFAGLEDI